MKGGEMEKAKVRTFSIAVFLRVHKVTGLPFPLLLPEVRHHVPLQLQLEPPVDSRVRLYLLLRTRILSHVVIFALVQSPGAHKPSLLAAPGGAHRDAQQLCRVDILVLHAQPSRCRPRRPRPKSTSWSAEEKGRRSVVVGTITEKAHDRKKWVHERGGRHAYDSADCIADALGAGPRPRGSVTVRLLWPLGIDERKDKWGVRTFPVVPARAFRAGSSLSPRAHIGAAVVARLYVESLVCLTAMEETRGPKVNFFF